MGLPPPSRDEIHLWPAPLDAAPTPLPVLLDWLDRNEQARAERLRDLATRRRYILAHAAHRSLTATYLGVAPAEVSFSAGTYGKPEPENRRDLHFNSSRSGDMAAIAFTCGTPLGVDLEQIRPCPDLKSVARHLFTTAETEAIAQSNHPEDLFYRFWTRKEAVVKATGEGMSRSLQSFTVIADDPAQASVRFLDQTMQLEWQLHDVEFAPGYACAVAYTGPPRKVCLQARFFVGHSERQRTA